TVSATDMDMTPETNSATVTIQVANNPIFSLDTPANNSTVSGVVDVTGWVITPPGKVLNSVKVFVDNVHVGLAGYPVMRPDVCAANPGANNCPWVGFSYSLNTASLSTGQHTITIVASIDDSGPALASGSTTVNVSR